MIQAIRRTLTAAAAVAALAVAVPATQAQFNSLSNYGKTHGGSVSVGGFGQFSTQYSTNPNVAVYTVPTTVTGRTAQVGIFNQQQTTTTSAGFVSSIQFHPVSWAGVVMNYGFTHYTERFGFAYAGGATVTGRSSNLSVAVPTDMHELTGGYSFHSKRKSVQPFVNVGGGAIDFSPSNASNQWRGAGYAELGFDIPTSSPHLAFRVSGRGLVYQTPDFYSPTGVEGLRITEEPAISAVYKF